jgi:hypothetical protein
MRTRHGRHGSTVILVRLPTRRSPRAILAAGLLVLACHRPRARDPGIVEIDVRVSGRGQVVALDLGAWCEDWCIYRVRRGATVRFRAVPQEDRFTRWTGPCGMGPFCTFAAVGDVRVRALFGANRPALPIDRTTPVR